MVDIKAACDELRAQAKAAHKAGELPKEGCVIIMSLASIVESIATDLRRVAEALERK